MQTKRGRFSSQADVDLLAALRTLAKQDGRPFEYVLEEAMRVYTASRDQSVPRASVMAHFRASLEKNRELGKLLAE